MHRPRKLWGLSVAAVVILAVSSIASADPIAAELDNAKAVYKQELAAAHKELDGAFRLAIRKVAARGDLDGVKAIVAQKEALDKSGTLPTAPEMKLPVAAFTRARDQAGVTLNAAFSQAVREYTKKLLIDQATSVQEQQKAFAATGRLESAAPVTNGAKPVTPVTPPVATDDPILDRLNKAKKKHSDMVLAANTKLSTGIGERVLEIASKGELDKVKLLQAAKQAVDAGDSPPDVNDTIYKLLVTRQKREIDGANRILLGAYRLAISTYKRSRNTAAAAAVEQEMEQFSSASASATLLPSRGRALNLISLLDLGQDKLRGDWTIDDGKLKCLSSHGVPKVRIPYYPPEEYDFKMVWSQPKLRHEVCALLTKNGKQLVWTVGGTEGKYAFQIRLDAKGQNPTQGTLGKYFKPNAMHTTIVKVRKDSIKAYLNGKLLAMHKTDFSDLQVGVWHRSRFPDQLGVGCDDPTIFHTIELIEVSGKGKPVR